MEPTRDDNPASHRGRNVGPALRQRLLVGLYGHEGKSVARALENRLVQMPVVPRPAGWSADDVWLIAYPDQFRGQGQSPLATLAALSDGPLAPFCGGVHVLPFHPSSSDEGFAVTDFAQVDSAHGSWHDIDRLAGGRRLMIDAVINHMSATSDWFQSFMAGQAPYDKYFVTAEPEADTSAVVRPRTHPLLTEFETSEGPKLVWTTFSADQVDLDYRNPDVLLAVIDVLLRFVQHGAGALRLDAVGFLWKDPGRASIHLPETHALVQLIRSCIDDVAPGALVITETNVPHRENVSYLNDDVPEAHAVYQFALAPLVADAILTEDVTVLVDWANSIDREKGPGQTFLNFLASHDGVGLRAVEDLLAPDRVERLVEACLRCGGEVSYRSTQGSEDAPYELNTTWFDLMSHGVSEELARARHVAAHAVMLALPGVPLFYVHSLFGSSNDHQAYARTGEKRSLNRQRFDNVDGLFPTAADSPSDPGDETRASSLFGALADLVTLRRRTAAFHPEGSSRVDSVDGAITVTREYGDSRAVWMINLSDHPVVVSGDRALEPYEVRVG